MTSHTLAPAAPDGAGGWYRSPVAGDARGAATTASASRASTRTEYRVDGGAFAHLQRAVQRPARRRRTRSSTARSTTPATPRRRSRSRSSSTRPRPPRRAPTRRPAAPGPVTLTLTAADATSGVALTEYQVDAAGAFRRVRRAALRGRAEWITYDAANKPAFTAARRVHDRVPLDRRAPATSRRRRRSRSRSARRRATRPPRSRPATLDPAQPGPGRTYPAPVGVKLSALDPAPAGRRRRTSTSTPPARSGRRRPSA